MKRLYVRSGFQGRGVGTRLATALLDEACAAGYTAMRLDTVPAMRAAIGCDRLISRVARLVHFGRAHGARSTRCDSVSSRMRS